jgi:hypothetical protein
MKFDWLAFVAVVSFVLIFLTWAWVISEGQL